MKKCSVHPRTSLTILKILALTLALCACQFNLARAQPKQKVIAMTQIAEGFDLDDVRRGIIDAIKKGGFADAKIHYENAQGDVGTAVQIAQRDKPTAPVSPWQNGFADRIDPARVFGSCRCFGRGTSAEF